MIAFKCPSCGIPISAADTLAGQLASCSRCNGEFRIPGLVIEDRRRSPRKKAGGCGSWLVSLIVVIVGIIVIGKGCDRPSAAPFKAGEICFVTSSDGKEAPAMLDWHSMEEFISAIENDNSLALLRLESSGQVFQVPVGTRARIRENRIGRHSTYFFKVELLDGDRKNAVLSQNCLRR